MTMHDDLVCMGNNALIVEVTTLCNITTNPTWEADKDSFLPSILKELDTSVYSDKFNN